MKLPAIFSNLTTKQLVAVVLAVLAVFGVSVVITNNGDSTTVTINLRSADGGPTSVTTTTGALDAIKQSAETHTELNGSPPVCNPVTAPVSSTCVTPQQYSAGVDQVNRLKETRPLAPLNPQAAGSIPGCRSRFISRNYSSRNGLGPNSIWLHQTISTDNGFVGVNAITGYFNTAGPDVSSHLVMAGAKAACNYIVPISQKAWTQTGFNSRAISIEVTGTQSQGYYVKGAGRARLVQVLAYIGKTWRIPLRRGSISGCTVTAGIVDHNQGGSCAGNHNDISPYRAEIAGIIRDAAAINSTSARRVSYPNVEHFGRKRHAWCYRLAVIRKNAKADGWNAKRVETAERYKELIGKGSTTKCKFV